MMGQKVELFYELLLGIMLKKHSAFGTFDSALVMKLLKSKP